MVLFAECEIEEENSHRVFLWIYLLSLKSQRRNLIMYAISCLCIYWLKVKLLMCLSSLKFSHLLNVKSQRRIPSVYDFMVLYADFEIAKPECLLYTIVCTLDESEIAGVSAAP